jgi:hypothetical protein
VSTLVPERERQAASIDGPAPVPGGAPRHPAARRLWLGRAMVAAGLGMIPWLVALAVTLPASTRAAHWPAAWIGLDSMEGLGLLATGLLLLRRDIRCCLTAAVTAALILTDAWFDVTTAAPGSSLVTAVLMAACVEIPVSVMCAAVAVRMLRNPPARAGVDLADPTC